MRRSRWIHLVAAGVALLLASGPAAGAAFGQTSGKTDSKRLPRWYEGAPPFVPHDIELRKGICQECHTTGEQGAPITPHPTRSHFCIECHVPQDQAVPPFEKTRAR